MSQQSSVVPPESGQQKQVINKKRADLGEEDLCGTPAGCSARSRGGSRDCLSLGSTQATRASLRLVDSGLKLGEVS